MCILKLVEEYTVLMREEKDAKKKKCQYSYETSAKDYVESMEK